MATVTKIGPADHGRPMTRDEFENGSYEEGYQYEIIDGKLYVSPLPDLPENRIQEWLNDQLKWYARQHPEVINYVSSGARVFVPGRPGLTIPEPDQAAYHDFPRHLPVDEVDWEEIGPVLVAEVLLGGEPEKDLVRNVELYLQVPTIREYWVVDARNDPNRPTMHVYRRRGQKWQRVINIAPGETYTTRLLPGFELTLDPRG
jgi:Uma2 family endonuclease